MKLFNQIQIFAIALSTAGTFLAEVQPSQAASLSVSGASCASSIVAVDGGNTPPCTDPFSTETESLVSDFEVATGEPLTNSIAESQTAVFLSDENEVEAVQTNEPSMASGGLGLLFFGLPVGMMLISKKSES